MKTMFLLLATWMATVTPSWAGPTSARAPDAGVEVVEAQIPQVPSDWTVVPGALVDVHADSADRPTALRLSRHASTAVPRLAKTLALPVGPRIHVILAHTQAQFSDLQPGKSPDWADGTAWPHRGWIYLRAPRLRGTTTSTLEQVFDHEIVHILLGRAFGSRSVPRWLQEGVAQLLAREYTPELTQTLARGTLGDNLLSLRELGRGFPTNAARAHLAYAQSADLVAFINNQYGPKALPTLVQQLSRGEGFATSIRVATGLPVDEVDAAWRSRLQSSPFGLSAVFDEGIWWAFGALLVPIAWFSVRRRNRKKLAHWKREEVLEDALYRAIERSMTPDGEPKEEGDDDAGPPIWKVPPDQWH